MFHVELYDWATDEWSEVSRHRSQDRAVKVARTWARSFPEGSVRVTCDGLAVWLVDAI